MAVLGGAGQRIDAAASVLATCSDFPNQAAAQRAHNTRDGDGDGVYCESLPCPCLKPGDSGGGGGGNPTPAPKPKSSCVRPQGVLHLVFSRAKYPNIRRHFLAAVKRGWPRVMVLNRKGADDRRDRLLEDVPTRPGFDRDEYPAAVGRGKPNGDLRGLVRGINPVGLAWRTWRTSQAARTDHTGPPWARSSAGSATAPGSSTPSPDLCAIRGLGSRTLVAGRFHMKESRENRCWRAAPFASLRQRAPSQREFARVQPVAYAADPTRTAEWRFCWSCLARTPWARPLAPARAGEAGAASPVCAQTREGLAGPAPVRLRRGACGGTRRRGSGRPLA